MQQNDNGKHTLLVIDDIADNLMLMNEVLHDTFDRHRGRQLAAPLPHHLACGSAPGGSRS